MRKVYKIYEIEDVLPIYIKYELDNISYNLSKNNEIEEIDLQLQKDFFDDIDNIENETKEVINKKILRYQKIVNKLKDKYKYKCQICGYSFLMNNGKNYCEAHHIKMLSMNGSQNEENVIILCANHHRMFHYASEYISIGELLGNKRIIKIEGQEYIIEFK